MIDLGLTQYLQYFSIIKVSDLSLRVQCKVIQCFIVRFWDVNSLDIHKYWFPTNNYNPTVYTSYNSCRKKFLLNNHCRSVLRLVWYNCTNVLEVRWCSKLQKWIVDQWYLILKFPITNERFKKFKYFFVSNVRFNQYFVGLWISIDNFVQLPTVQ